MIVDFPICLNCKHYYGIRTCDAFPEEIPDEIWMQGNEHSKPLPDQENDIVFEPIETEKK